MRVGDQFIPHTMSLGGPPRRLQPAALAPSSQPEETATLSGVTQCPRGPSTSPRVRALARQGAALAEESALQTGSGPTSAPLLGQLREFRQGICPYLAQQTQQGGGSQSALHALAEALASEQMDPVEFFQKAHEVGGDSFKVGEMLFESRPLVTQQILATTGENFSKSPLQIGSLGAIYGDQNIFLAPQDAWKERRSLMMPFFSGTHVMSDGTHQQVARTVDRHLSAWGQLEQPVDLNTRMPMLTLDSALQHMFSVELSDAELQQAVELFQKAGEKAGDQMLGRAPNRDAALEGQLDGLATRILRGRAAGEGRDDLLQALLDRYADQPQTLRKEVITMALLGHETTANLLNWGLAELSQHPGDLVKLREEADRIVGKDTPGAQRTLSQTRELSWGREVVRETTRLHPPNYLLLREANRDVEIDDPQGGRFLIAKGTQVLMPVDVVNDHSLQDSAWDPERDGGKLFSFGGGQRVCLGQVFARMEASLILSEIARRYDISAVARDLPRPETDFSSRPSESRFHFSPRT